ncbi:MAG: hypothetical protein KC912_24450 [Proteobacteria bacterium]|nr:hypothetical protein [Pseudomonadota bacterium]
MPDWTRREVLGNSAILIGAAAIGCGEPDPQACLDGDGPAWTDDGPFPDSCQVTASDIEGPFFSPDAPERADLDTWGDEGTSLQLAGRVLDSGCIAGIEGAVVELWHADPSGGYDNASNDMRYRATLVCDADGQWEVRTLLPGRYRNAGTFRPRHIHIKVSVEGVERLITQLYFEGDPYNECDPWVNTSLVLPFEGSTEDAMSASVDLVLS